MMHIFTSTGDEAPMYKTVPVHEPQYREDFLKCESQLLSFCFTAFCANPDRFSSLLTSVLEAN